MNVLDGKLDFDCGWGYVGASRSDADCGFEMSRIRMRNEKVSASVSVIVIVIVRRTEKPIGLVDDGLANGIETRTASRSKIVTRRSVNSMTASESAFCPLYRLVLHSNL